MVYKTRHKEKYEMTAVTHKGVAAILDSKVNCKTSELIKSVVFYINKFKRSAV